MIGVASGQGVAIDASIERGLGLLRSSQLTTGEFPTFVSADPTMQAGLEFDSSPFCTGMVAYALSLMVGRDVTGMSSRAAVFLRAQMEPPAVWRFRTLSNPKQRMLPPDVDDTACVSMVLDGHGVAFPPNRSTILGNRRADGVFLTWIFPRRLDRVHFPLRRYWPYALPTHPLWKTGARRDDVNGVVNAHVIAYLGERDETRAAIRYLEQIVEQGQEAHCDRWYQDRLTFHLAFSRACERAPSLVPLVAVIRDRILAQFKPEGRIRTPLDTAFAVNALMNFGFRRDVPGNFVSYFLSSQAETGAWPCIPIFWSGWDRTLCWGSEALTTAFCVAALARYRDSAGEAR